MDSTAVIELEFNKRVINCVVPFISSDFITAHHDDKHERMGLTGWMDGWMDRWMDGWIDRWIDG